MTTDFNIDNPGSAFGDDDIDLDDLLAEAEAGEGPENPEDADTSNLMSDNYDEAPQNAAVDAPEPRAATPAPTATPEPAKPAERRTEAPAPRMSIPTMEDEVSRVEAIIRVSDAIRRLSREERDVVVQFITGGESRVGEANLVIAAINADLMLSTTMETLKSAKEAEQVDRAFYIMDLSDAVLYSLGSLVSVFTNEEGDRHGSRSDYARTLVRNIEKLDAKAMSFVNATEGVLRSARNEH